MRAETFTFDSNDGLAIHVFQWLPDEGLPIKGVVQIHHGLAEHAARYERFATLLVAKGYAVYASDHRGHGRSVRSPDDLGHYADEDGWVKAVEDMHHLTKIARAKHEGAAHVMVCHSMGSLLAQHYLALYGDTTDGAVFSGSAAGAGLLVSIGRIAARVERKRLGPRGRSKVLDKMSFGSFNDAFKPTRTESDWLSRDQKEVDKYIEDPLCGFLSTTQLWVDFLGGLQFINDPANRARTPRDLPIYILSGSKDPVGEDTKSTDKLIKAYKQAGLTRVDHKYYKNARHEIFNEINRDEVHADVIAWIDAIVSSRK